MRLNKKSKINFAYIKYITTFTSTKTNRYMETLDSLRNEYRSLNKGGSALLTEKEFILSCLQKQLERIDLGLRSFSEESKNIHRDSYKIRLVRYHEALEELTKAKTSL